MHASDPNQRPHSPCPTRTCCTTHARTAESLTVTVVCRYTVVASESCCAKSESLSTGMSAGADLEDTRSMHARTSSRHGNSARRTTVSATRYAKSDSAYLERIRNSQQSAVRPTNLDPLFNTMVMRGSGATAANASNLQFESPRVEGSNIDKA